MPSKTRKQEKSKGSSPLDEKARALTEQQEKLRAEIERNERLIKEAPKIAKERERTRREELIKRRSSTDARRGSPVALHDRRHLLDLVDPSKPLRQKKLRAERRRGRRLFFVLLFAFGLVIYWAYWTFTHQ